MNRVAQSLLALLLCAVSVHCGGGGGSGGGGIIIIVPPDGDPVFVGDPSCSGTMAVSMQPGDVNGAMFEVEIRLTGDVANFFGAGFGISFSGATFVGIDDTAASLLDPFADSEKEFLACAGPSAACPGRAAGELEVSATLLDSSLVFTPAAGTPLVTLTFNATGDGAFTFMVPPQSEVRVCPTPTTCTAATVSWCDASLTV